MFCPNCGAEGTGNFCTNCGHPLKGQSAAPEVAALKDRLQSAIDKRLSNALIKDAEPDFEVFFAVSEVLGLGAGKGAVNSVSLVAKKLVGGLWVGGTTYLADDAIIFRPNLLNRLVHKQDCSVIIPLHEITKVNKRFGIGTQIIDIGTLKGVLSIRCYWATSFAEAINSQIHKARWH